VTNNLEGNTVDTVAENMPLVAGGAVGTTKVYVDATEGGGNPKPFPDGENGCNLKNDSYIDLVVSSSDSTVATVSPTDVRILECTENNGQTLTVTPVGQGTATITVARKADTATSAPGTFYYDTAKFTVTVAPPPNNPPSIEISGVTGGQSYNKGSVPTATCNVTDTEDGPSSFPATLSAITGPYASDGIGSQTASCSYTDAGGATAGASVSYSIVDPSAPTVGYTLNPASPNGTNGWYKGNVTLT
jgi:hypothetical protein